MILKVLIAHSDMSESDLVSSLNKDPQRVALILDQLSKEGFIEKTDFLNVPSDESLPVMPAREAVWQFSKNTFRHL